MKLKHIQRLRKDFREALSENCGKAFHQLIYGDHTGGNFSNGVLQDFSCLCPTHNKRSFLFSQVRTLDLPLS